MKRRALGCVIAAVSALGAAGVANAAPLHITASGHFLAPPTTAQCRQEIGIACYSPLQIEQAYNMPTLYNAGLTGSGKTIVIVDSFGSPTIQQDLQTFDTAYGLPAPPSFQIIQPAGAVPPYNQKNSLRVGWAEETSLDVEYAHSIAPGANILLVETPTSENTGVSGFPAIDTAEEYVIQNHLGDVISQSFATAEETFPSVQALMGLTKPYTDAAAAGITAVAGSGDAGPSSPLNAAETEFFTTPVANFPASDPDVVAVGGTQLHLNAAGNRTAPDNVWNDTLLLGSPAASGGGVSSDFARPSYQDGVQNIVGSHRGLPDVSMSAAVNGGVVVYFGFTGHGVHPGYFIIGGTSEATPEFAALVAVADQAAGHDLGLIQPTLYGDGSGTGLVDITKGNNTVRFNENGRHIIVPGYAATSGYDLSSGLGTPDGPALVNELAGTSIGGGS